MDKSHFEPLFRKLCSISSTIILLMGTACVSNCKPLHISQLEQTFAAFTVRWLGANQVEITSTHTGTKRRYSCPKDNQITSEFFDPSTRASVSAHPTQEFLVLGCIGAGLLVDLKNNVTMRVYEWDFATTHSAFVPYGSSADSIELVRSAHLGRFVASGGKQGAMPISAPHIAGDPAQIHSLVGFLANGALRFKGACCGAATVYDACPTDWRPRSTHYIRDNSDVRRPRRQAVMAYPSPCDSR